MGNDYSGLDTYASYEEDEGSTTYVVTQKGNQSTNTSTNQGGVGGEREMAALSMSSSGSSSDSFKELQKR